MRYVFSVLLTAVVCSLALPCLAQDSAEAQAAAAGVTAPDEQTSSGAPRAIKDKWAVVIGIDRFKDKRIPTLRFSAKDARDFATFLVEKANFKKDHVLLLLNENASRHNIDSALGDTWLPKRVLEDDMVLIYASTHGSPRELDVGGDNFLIAYDTNQEELFTTGIKLQDLSSTVRQRTHCDRIVLILDACNSGAAQAGGKGLLRTTNFDVGSLAGKGQIVISSSSMDQRSWESKRYSNGVFTRNLINVLDQQKEKANLESTFEQLKDKVQQEVRFDRKAFQTPMMKSKWEGDALILTAKPSSPREVGGEEPNLPYSYESVLTRETQEEPKPEATQSVATTSNVSSPDKGPPLTPVPTPVHQPQPVNTVPQALPNQATTAVSSSIPPISTTPSDLPSYGVMTNTTAPKANTPVSGKEADAWMKYNAKWGNK
ncbi:MAG: caspase family protein [Cyanobacteria bacterium]|nr:caspase family protein [Cyanobacteriota bacterium]